MWIHRPKCGVEIACYNQLVSGGCVGNQLLQLIPDPTAQFTILLGSQMRSPHVLIDAHNACRQLAVGVRSDNL